MKETKPKLPCIKYLPKLADNKQKNRSVISKNGAVYHARTKKNGKMIINCVKVARAT